jgi:flagellar biogenesis protein FliO
MLHSPLYSVLSSLFALAAVLALILLAAKLLRLSGITPKSTGRLSLQSTLPLDPRRRLQLVRADGREFLLLTGGATDLLIAELGNPTP